MHAVTGIGALHDIQSQPTVSLWSLDLPLKIKVTLATYVNVRDRGEVRIQYLMLLTTDPIKKFSAYIIKY